MSIHRHHANAFYDEVLATSQVWAIRRVRAAVPDVPNGTPWSGGRRSRSL